MIASAILQLSVKCLGIQETNTVILRRNKVSSPLGGKIVFLVTDKSPINYSQTAHVNHPDAVLLINAQNQWVKCINVLNKQSIPKEGQTLTASNPCLVRSDP